MVLWGLSHLYKGPVVPSFKANVSLHPPGVYSQELCQKGKSLNNPVMISDRLHSIIEFKISTIYDQGGLLLPPPTRTVSLNTSTQRWHGNNLMSDMCHRQLRFVKSNDCGHLSLTSEAVIDCLSITCQLSGAHPSGCADSRCRRYYEKPNRVITQEVDVHKVRRILSESHNILTDIWKMCTM